MARRRRSLFVLPVIVFACSIMGGIYGPKLEGASAATESEDLDLDVRNFSKVLSLVEENFADKVTADKAVYKGAIPGMLRTLDPHSNFFDPRDFAILKEEQKGHYYGVGMTVSARNGKTVVMSPFGGSPAYKAGIRPADVILEVNDKKTDGLNTSEVADLLKGPRGTHVQIVIGREGLEKPITFDVIRDEISHPSVL